MSVKKNEAALPAATPPAGAVAWAQFEDGKAVAVSFTRSKVTGCTTPLYTTPQPASADVVDLDALRVNSWDLRCFNISGGEDIAWEVIEHHGDAPHERRVAVVYRDDPRAALLAALKEKPNG